MIDPRAPDFTSTPASAARAQFGYAARGFNAPAQATVVTPFFNTGAIFEETAACVLGQSLQAFEWIIVNDGSTDPDALARLQAYRHRDPRIRVIDHQQNNGLSAARNTGFRHASAACVFQLDADDLIEPTTLEKCAWYLATHPDCAFVKGLTVGFGSQEYLWTKGFHDGAEFLRENRVTATAMVRREVHHAVGGYDETMRGGLEDWDFWLRCAARGFWGETLPEFLDWYRRRNDHGEAWSHLRCQISQTRFREALQQRYSTLYAGATFPSVPRRWPKAFEDVAATSPVENPLTPRADRMMLIVPWLTLGGADKFNLRLIDQMVRRGWEVTVVATLKGDQSWLPEFTRLTPDVFVLPHIVAEADQPAAIRALIDSRQPQAVVISNSEMAYQILPFLRAHCGDAAFIDYCHMEEEYWKNGGYPRYAARTQELLDLNIVSSQHLKRWMVQRGAQEDRVEVCTTNEDLEQWAPDARLREQSRARLALGQDPVILYAVRLCEQKRPRVFAETMRRLRDEGLLFSALVAGDGPDAPWLDGFIEEHDLAGCVRRLGPVPSEHVRELMAASDVFFLPSLWEGISLAIYEAMAMGLPVVGADVGGQRELVTPECGVLIARCERFDDEVERYVGALRSLLQDPNRGRAMGAAARARIAEDFSIDLMGRRMESLVRRAIELHRIDPRPTIGEGFALECATRGVEYMRISALADKLWEERDELRRQISSLQAEVDHVRGTAPDARAELAELEGSRAWRIMCAIKHNRWYRVIARLRFGPHWDVQDASEPAAAKLARLRATRAYRAIAAIKNTRAYRLYRRVRTPPPSPADQPSRRPQVVVRHLNGTLKAASRPASPTARDLEEAHAP